MKKWAIITSMALIACIVFTGCASKGFVRDEISKAKAEITNEQAKLLKEEIGKLEMESSKRMTTIETNYALKSALESATYNLEQKLMKDIENRIAEIKIGMKRLEDMKDASVDKLSQNLQSSLDIFMKQLRAQKDGIEQAMEELDKLMPTTTPTPPENPNTEPK